MAPNVVSEVANETAQDSCYNTLIADIDIIRLGNPSSLPIALSSNSIL